MAYNRKNILTRILEIQNITLEHTKRGSSYTWVYKNIIFPKYNISKSTYDNYIGTNARRDLQDLLNKNEVRKKTPPDSFNNK